MSVSGIAIRVLAGAVAANAVPHLVHGVSGRAFQTPFAQPPGKGKSSALVNVAWGFGNLGLAWALGRRTDLRCPCHAGAFGTGALGMSAMLAWHFGRFNGGDRSVPLQEADGG